MADNTKPKSFRIDDETAEKFKQIAEKIGGNQQQTLAKLIETFEFQSGKATLTDKTNIEAFERHVGLLTRLYMTALEDNQNAAETIRTEFDALLKSKDATIQDLQAKLAAAAQAKEAAVVAAEEHKAEVARLNDIIHGLNAQADNLRSALTDKENLNRALTSSCNDLKAKVESMEAAAAQATTLRGELDAALQKCSNLEKQLQEAATEKNAALDHLQLEHDRATLKLERELHDKLQAAQTAYQADIAQYQQKYRELLERLEGGK